MKDFKSIAEKSNALERIQKLIDRERIETQWNQHWKITDGETVAGQASQGFVENGV